MASRGRPAGANSTAKPINGHQLDDSDLGMWAGFDEPMPGLIDAVEPGAPELVEPPADITSIALTDDVGDLTLTPEEIAEIQAGEWRDAARDGDPEAVERVNAEERERRIRNASLREAELQYIRIVGKELAEEKVRRERAAAVGMPPMVSLSDLLAEPEEEERWRIAGLWPAGGNVLLAAQAKAGKTHLAINAARSILDGSPFLGSHLATPLEADGKLTVVDFELSRGKLRQWYREQQIRNAAQFNVWPMKGFGSSFDVLDKHRRKEIAEKLAFQHTRILVLDCLAPVLSSLGLEEQSNQQVGQFLEAMNALAAEAGIEEMLIIHHMGHGAERSRGASRLNDWPDVMWRLKLERDQNGEPDRTKPRAFDAYGRDVDQPETMLHYDDRTGRLSMIDGSRAAVRAAPLIRAVLSLLDAKPGQSGRAIREAMVMTGTPERSAKDAIAAAESFGYVEISAGPRGAKLMCLTARGKAELNASNGRLPIDVG